jgi:hypothetical protein
MQDTQEGRLLLPYDTRSRGRHKGAQATVGLRLRRSFLSLPSARTFSHVHCHRHSETPTRRNLALRTLTVIKQGCVTRGFGCN